MKKRAIAGVFVLALAVSGCSNLGTRDQRILSGAAIGAGVGAVGTVLTGGCVSCGTLIGGAVGAGAGYVIDHNEKARAHD